MSTPSPDEPDGAGLAAGREPLLHRLFVRRGVPLVTLRPDHRLVALNGVRLRTPGLARPTPPAWICAVAFHAELRPTLREVLVHLLDPAAQVRRRRTVIGESSVTQAEAQAWRDNAFAVDAAVAAAARHLGHEVSVTGRGVRVDAARLDPSRGAAAHAATRLRPGDRIVAADHRPATAVEELLTLLTDRTVIDLTVQSGRPGEDADRTERLRRGDDGRWGLRVSTDAQRFSVPLDVTVELPPDLSGPSLGLACALAVMDACTECSLSRAVASGGASSGEGRVVVATGSITHLGQVGEVGGLDLKARTVGAHPQVQQFLVPPTPAAELARIRRLAGRSRVTPVASLAEAVAALTSG